jgi:hypothetical protein
MNPATARKPTMTHHGRILTIAAIVWATGSFSAAAQD